MVSGALDEFRLETIAELHAVSVELFVPFVIHRLAQVGAPDGADLRVNLRGIGDWDQADRQLRLTWEAESALSLPPGVPDTTVTEWAALDVEQRHRQKVRQLLDNPYGVDGYVVVFGVAARRVIFSFHRFAEDNA